MPGHAIVYEKIWNYTHEINLKIILHRRSASAPSFRFIKRSSNEPTDARLHVIITLVYRNYIDIIVQAHYNCPVLSNRDQMNPLWMLTPLKMSKRVIINGYKWLFFCLCGSSVCFTCTCFTYSPNRVYFVLFFFYVIDIVFFIRFDIVYRSHSRWY